jgi:hypothetical protein
MTDELPFKVVRSNSHDEMSAVENEADGLNPNTFPSIAYRFKFAALVRGDVDGGQGQTAPAAVVESLRGKSCWIERQGGAC